MDIPDFIARCDRYCAKADVTRTWLSKRLLHDTYRLDLLSKGEVDIGVKRLARAADDLAALEREATTPRPTQPEAAA